MASAWGDAWGANWGSAWGVRDGSSPPEPPTPPPPSGDQLGFGYRPSGGFPGADRGPTKEQRRRSRILHGLEAEIVESVAERQAEALDLDEIQRRQELEGELRLRGLELETEHLEALNARREALISEEIGRRLRAMLEDEDAAILLMIAASL